MFTEILRKQIQDASSRLEAIQPNYPVSLSPIPGIKALLFDVYGTLLISASGDISLADTSEEAKQSKAAAVAVQHGGFQFCGDNGAQLAYKLYREAIKTEHRRLAALHYEAPEVDIREIWHHVLRYLKSRGYISGRISSSAIDITALSFELESNKIWPMPNAEAVLRKLGSRYPLGIVSNAQFYTPLSFQSLFGCDEQALGFREDLIAYSYRYRSAKPSSFLFEQVLEVLERSYNIHPEETVYIGNDMLNDIHTASRCSCKTVLFAGDKRSLRLREDDERCRETVPNAVISDLNQIAELLA